ncbi:peroxisomal biogenesis factor 11 family protein [Medicago truncatula]|uniref:Peroxisomal biogenesis factor 11 family protein n=1 Tax=Medicago truncatula TaxID=3880 RepID=A0A072TJ86_MEDTR|nr:peroxisomal biogenesis factor 11 family protein [Medicago truncatula]
MNDTVDKLVIFLAKRDGIDKLEKTFQEDIPICFQACKLACGTSGLSRKAFRTGRFLTGFNALRRNPGSTLTLRLLAVLSNSGEMVYFFFDHFLWLSRIGTVDANLAKKMSFISAFGEAVGYVFFIIADFILLNEGLKAEKKLRSSEGKDNEKEIQKLKSDRIMRLMAVAANVADLIIALAEIEPNPFCNHTISLGISGLVSAWAGWYRNWPS